MKTTLLVILDGWGHSTSKAFNAISAANTPNWDAIIQNQPHRCIDASGEAVGLPAGQMGNSEVGHMHLGAGRVIYQNLARINQDISKGTFAQNPVMLAQLNRIKQQHSALHIIGLVSSGGVHSHEDHIIALIKLAKSQKLEKIYVHAILDGRDTPPQSAQASIRKLETQLDSKNHPQHRIVSVSGRFYAMDRDERWERVEEAYQAIVHGQSACQYQNSAMAISQSYKNHETDEFVRPSVIVDQNNKPISIAAEDAIIFMNFRADRARQLSRALVDPEFSHFPRTRIISKDNFTTLTAYEPGLTQNIVYPGLPIVNDIGAYLAGLGKKQMRIAETEKYAHVTFFFNCGREAPYPGEARKLIPSPKVRTYDLKPEMSAMAITDALVKAIETQSYDLIVCNYANGDMVGHTGNFNAAIQAAETIDQCLGHIKAAIQQTDSQCLITADHGNLEKMLDQKTQQPLTSHTTEPVPLIYLGNRPIIFSDTPGSLANIAPSLLELMDLTKPEEMTMDSLIKPRH